MSNGAKRGLAAAAVLFMMATAASRVLGLVREQVMLYYLGLGAEMGAFTVAFKVPSLLRTLVADTALSAAFIPVFTELLTEERRREAWAVASTVVIAATAVLGVLSVLGIVYAPWVISLAAPGYKNPETIGLAVDLTRIMFPTVLIFGLAGIAMGILNSHDHFTLPALAPIAWNLIIIGAVTFFARDYGFYALALGVLVGTAVQLAIQIPSVGVRMRGVGLPRPASLRNPAVKRLGLLLGPVVLTLGIVNFNALISTMFASFVSEPAPAVIDKAFRLFQLPQGMFAIAIGTVLFPTLSRLASEGNLDRFRRTLSVGLRQIFFVTLPFSVFFIVLGRPTVRLVFEHGRVTPEDTAQVAWALAFFSIGMAFVSANTLLNRAFYGIQKARFNNVLALTKAMPMLKKASAQATCAVSSGVTRPCSNTRRTVGRPSTIKKTENGKVTKNICRKPTESVRRNLSRFPSEASRDSVGNKTVPMAIANMPCGSWNRRNALSITAGAGSLTKLANMVLIKALKFTIPRVNTTGPKSRPNRLTAGFRSEAGRGRPTPRMRTPTEGIWMASCTAVPTNTPSARA